MKLVVTATSNGVVRDEKINTSTNILFKRAKNYATVRKIYERFWGGTVKVLEIYVIGLSRKC